MLTVLLGRVRGSATAFLSCGVHAEKYTKAAQLQIKLWREKAAFRRTWVHRTQQDKRDPLFIEPTGKANSFNRFVCWSGEFDYDEINELILVRHVHLDSYGRLDGDSRALAATLNSPFFIGTRTDSLSEEERRSAAERSDPHQWEINEAEAAACSPHVETVVSENWADPEFQKGWRDRHVVSGESPAWI